MTFPTTHPALARALAAREYTIPTAVQTAVLADDAGGRDMLVSAQTGSGKTVAFGLAMAETLLGSEEQFGHATRPLALIIAPTRELALQVQRELAWLYGETAAQVVSCVGGMNPREEARELAAGAHIVVGTPGRLRDHIERKRLDLAGLKAVVLDEADEMLDLGFREDLEFILDATPAERRTLLFSATLPRPIEALARRFQRDALRIETIRRDEQHADIEYQALRVAAHEVENAVVNVLRFHEARATLVFCATREAVKRMHARLADRGFSAVALSGELTQAERSQALHSLRDGRARVLIATDVAARGLDLPDLALVIHADLPNNADTLLHRSGRTGRAGKKGLCVTIVPFNRRRKAETLFNIAKIKAAWSVPPTAKEIEARDQERFMAHPVLSEPASEEELTLAASLQAALNAHQIAIALVRMHRAQLPKAEKLGLMPVHQHAEGSAAPRTYQREREPRANRHTSDRFEPAADRSAPAHRGSHRDSGREMVWFRLSIGRDRNADPRWLVPLICKAGNIGKAQIGSIKVNDRDTRFQIEADAADQFAEAVRTSRNKEGTITRVGVYTHTDDTAVNAAIDAMPQPNTSAAKRPDRDKPAARSRPKPPRADHASPHQNSAEQAGPERERLELEGPELEGPEMERPPLERAELERAEPVERQDTAPGPVASGEPRADDAQSGHRKPHHRKGQQEKAQSERPQHSPPTKYAGKRPYAKADGKPDHSNPDGKRPHSNTDGKRPHSNTDGKRPYSNADGKRPHSNTDGKRQHSNADGKRPYSNADGKRPYSNADGKRPYSNADGKRSYSNADGKRPYSNADGKRPYSNADGKRPYAKAGGARHAGSNAAGSNAAGQSTGASRSPSKYAKKKKHRTPSTAAG